MDTLLIKKESLLNDCQDNGMQGRNLYRELRGEIIDIVPDVAGDFDDIDNYYGEVNRCIVGLLSDIGRVYSQAYATETDFIIALDREVRRARYLLQALKGLNRLVDPRPLGRLGGMSLIQGYPAEFQRVAAEVEVALAGKAFESMVIRDGDTIIGYRWDIIENILNKDAVNISEAEYAALARMFLGMNNLSDKERFLNTLADVVEGMSAAGAPSGVMFTFCQDKLAGIMRHAGGAIGQFRANQIADCEQSNAERHAMLQRLGLLEAISTLAVGNSSFSSNLPQFMLWGDSSGPISLSQVGGSSDISLTVRASEVTLSADMDGAHPNIGSASNLSFTIGAVQHGEDKGSGSARTVMGELATGELRRLHGTDFTTGFAAEQGARFIMGEVPVIGTALSAAERADSIAGAGQINSSIDRLEQVQERACYIQDNAYDVVIIRSDDGRWTFIDAPSTR